MERWRSRRDGKCTRQVRVCKMPRLDAIPHQQCNNARPAFSPVHTLHAYMYHRSHTTNMTITRSAATAALRSKICRQCVRSTRSFTQVVAIKPVQTQRSNQPACAAAVRWHSAPASSPKVYDFGQIKKLSESPAKETVLVGRQPSSSSPPPPWCTSSSHTTCFRRPRAI